jgi:ferrous iron transport protein B
MEINHTNNCDICPIHDTKSLEKLGVNMISYDYVVALAGNPNVGKSTVFNSLTGLRQHTGNWPGKTVVRAEGGFSYGGNRFKVIDLPGTYSLLSLTTDEEVARDFILFGRPDVTVVIADATRLERNLNLVLQILEISDRVVLCVNLIDEAKRKGININQRALSREFGVPVILTAARQNVGIPELLKSINDVVTGKFICKPYRSRKEPRKVKKAVDTLSVQLESEYPNLPNVRWIAMRLLEGDRRIISALRNDEFKKYT